MNHVMRVHERLMAQLPVRTIPERHKPNVHRTSVHGDYRNNGRRSPERLAMLTKRIKALIAWGLQFDEVAEELGVSIATVTRHSTGKISQLRQDAA